jgi:hypothetical protein
LCGSKISLPWRAADVLKKEVIQKTCGGGSMLKSETNTYSKTSHHMKLKSHFLLLGSVLLIAASPAAFARGKGHGHKTPKAVAKDAAVSFESGDDAVVSEPGQADAGGSDTTNGQNEGTNGATPTDGGGSGEGTSTGNEGTGGETVVDKDPDGGATPVPIDWVKRGDHPEGNPDVIFYNMAGGPLTSGGPVAVKGNVARGQADKGAAIEASGGAAGPQVDREKKGPVALVKKGHVFLR